MPEVCPESPVINEKIDALSDKVDRLCADQQGLTLAVEGFGERFKDHDKRFKNGMSTMQKLAVADDRTNRRIDSLEQTYTGTMQAHSETMESVMGMLQRTHEAVERVEVQTKPIIQERKDRDGFWATLKDWKGKIALISFAAGAVLLIYSLWDKINGAGQP